jgi:membrane protein DedA with SNARE-associated domain/rhodanese-related sulfurtransferase
MQHVASEIERYGLLVVFVNVLLAEGGIPLPALPMLLMAGALATRAGYQQLELIAVGVIGCLIADLAWYWCGRHQGGRALGWLCRMSLTPDRCVRQTETVFLKVGKSSLLFAKFLPALSTVSVAMAGVARMPLSTFLPLDALGALLFVTVAILLGWIFQDSITNIVDAIARAGKLGLPITIAILCVYLFARWWRRRAFLRQLRMDRITVVELRRLIDEGRKPLILDVRPKEIRVRDGIIPGAVPGHLKELDPILVDSPRDSEAIVYCACPNEASSAVAARRLKEAGFKTIRPLLGGIDAWIAAGQPLERSPSFASTTNPIAT